jgi:hypothetical protein
MSAKKEVHFREVLATPEVGRSAYLLGVTDHYRLGNQLTVYTSYVIDIRDDGNTIETKNTIYKRAPLDGDAIEE